MLHQKHACVNQQQQKHTGLYLTCVILFKQTVSCLCVRYLLWCAEDAECSWNFGKCLQTTCAATWNKRCSVIIMHAVGERTWLDNNKALSKNGGNIYKKNNSSTGHPNRREHPQLKPKVRTVTSQWLFHFKSNVLESNQNNEKTYDFFNAFWQCCISS